MNIQNFVPNDTAVEVELFLLSEEFLADYRAGKIHSVSEFAEAHPDLADKILEDFPGLLIAEDLRQIPAGRESMPLQVGGYTLVRRIGAGGMGTVYEANHPMLSRRTAIKLLNRSYAQNASLSRRFLLEAELASRLNHPNIVPLLDFAEDQSVPYISMLFVEGASLDRILYNAWESDEDVELPTSNTRGKIRPGRDFQQIARIGAEVASALAHAHNRGTIHRDIKPGNLILDSNGKTWVTDFGLAILFNGQGEHESEDLVGTPRYMAPEQFECRADDRSDIYSLGVTLYELASGKPVWADLSEEQLKTRGDRELPDVRNVNPNVPSALADIIMTACAAKPGERYPSASELQTVLNRFAHSGVLGDRRQKMRTPAQKRRVFDLKTLIGVAIVCSALSAIATLTIAGTL